MRALTESQFQWFVKVYENDIPPDLQLALDAQILHQHPLMRNNFDAWNGCCQGTDFNVVEITVSHLRSEVAQRIGHIHTFEENNILQL